MLSPPYIPEYMRNARCDFVSLSGTQWYPILLGYCGAWLEKCGYQVKLLDAQAHNLGLEATEKLVADYMPDWLVVYTGRLSEFNDIEIADRLTEKMGCKTIIVGPYASISPRKTLEKSRNVNLLVTGEFELSVQEILECKRQSKIPNLVFKKGNEIIQNKERPYLNTSELDQFPFVSEFFKRHINIYKYKTISERYPFMDIFTGRGCYWGRCTYCLWVHSYIKGAFYNTRSIQNVIEELKYICKDMPDVKSVMLQDDTFTEERAVEFCEEKLNAGIKIPWSCYGRGNMSYKALKLMKKANCLNIHVGFESADSEVLKRIKKGLTVKRMTRFAEDAKRVGIRIHGDFAIGFPGETPESAQKTIEWACRLNPATAQFQLMIPFPGTSYYEEMVANGWLNDNGEPDMPQFSNSQIRTLAKKGYRSFYFSPQYLSKCIRHPYDYFFGRLKTIARAIPAMFWRKWRV